jgi:hypothetical protein
VCAGATYLCKLRAVHIYVTEPESVYEASAVLLFDHRWRVRFVVISKSRKRKCLQVCHGFNRAHLIRWLPCMQCVALKRWGHARQRQIDRGKQNATEKDAGTHMRRACRQTSVRTFTHTHTHTSLHYKFKVCLPLQGFCLVRLKPFLRWIAHTLQQHTIDLNELHVQARFSGTVLVHT